MSYIQHLTIETLKDLYYQVQRFDTSEEVDEHKAKRK